MQFSQGNLQAEFASAGTSCTWQFATEQYDYVGNAAANNAINGNGSVSAAGTVDLFGWSTGSTYYGINNSDDADDYSGDFVDWGDLAISNGGNTANSGWRTLTRDEWAYLFTNHTYGYATVAGVKGIIIVPDNYSGTAINSDHSNTENPFAYNTIDASTWASTYEPAGVVFLPAAGFRIPWFGQVQENAYYWSSTPVDGTNKYATLVGKPGNGDIITYGSGGNWPANDGFSVRLVKAKYYKYITYDANGGSGSMSVQEIENSGTLNASAFTRDGYAFAGWKDANGTFYRNNASITATESDKGQVTLYAQWVAQDEIDQYVGKVIGADGKLYKTVTAATNAGTTASGVVAYWGVTGSVEASNSAYRGLAVSTADVATFIPWCTDPSGWFAGSTLAQALDARNGWERTNSFGRPSSRDIEDIYGHHHQHQAAAAAYDYSVSRPTGVSPWFIPTMGQWNMIAQGLTGTTADISETDNPDYTYSNLSAKLTAAGASGLTWAVYWSSTEVDGTYMWTFDIGGEGSGRNGGRALSVAKTLSSAEFVRACFAFESAIPAVYTISYDANGGDGAPASQTKDGGMDLTLSSTVPTRDGFTFTGWATTADGTVAYAAGDTYTGNVDQTLYAQWEIDLYYIHANQDPQHTTDYYTTFYHGTQAYELPSGVEAYAATVSGDMLMLKKIAEGGDVLPNGEAVIIKAASENLILTPTDEAGVSIENNQLQGVDDPTAVPSDNCYVLSGNNTSGVGFYRFSGTIHAHKAYIDLDALSGGGGSAPKRLRFVFSQQNVATGADEVGSETANALRSEKRIEDDQLIIIRNGVRYNAQGQVIN